MKERLFQKVASPVVNFKKRKGTWFTLRNNTRELRIKFIASFPDVGRKVFEVSDGESRRSISLGFADIRRHTISSRSKFS